MPVQAQRATAKRPVTNKQAGTGSGTGTDASPGHTTSDSDSAATQGSSDDPSVTTDPAGDSQSESMETAEDTSVGDDEEEGDYSGSFYAAGDVSIPESCDIWSQDCLEGEKCTAVATTGSAPSANYCVPIAGEKRPEMNVP